MARRPARAIKDGARPPTSWASSMRRGYCMIGAGLLADEGRMRGQGTRVGTVRPRGAAPSHLRVPGESERRASLLVPTNAMSSESHAACALSALLWLWPCIMLGSCIMLGHHIGRCALFSCRTLRSHAIASDNIDSMRKCHVKSRPSDSTVLDGLSLVSAKCNAQCG